MRKMRKKNQREELKTLNDHTNDIPISDSPPLPVSHHPSQSFGESTNLLSKEKKVSNADQRGEIIKPSLKPVISIDQDVHTPTEGGNEMMKAKRLDTKSDYQSSGVGDDRVLLEPSQHGITDLKMQQHLKLRDPTSEILKQYNVLNIALFKLHLQLTSDEPKPSDPLQFLATTIQEIYQGALNKEYSSQQKLDN